MLGTPEGVLEKAGVNSFAFNWKEKDRDAELKRHLENLLQEITDQWSLDAALLALFTGTAAQQRLLAAACEWKAAALALNRPQIFKLLGQHAPLAMEDSESFEEVIARLEARAEELIDDLLGSVPSSDTEHGPVRHGFVDSEGELLTLAFGRETCW